MKVFAHHPHRRTGRFVEWEGLARHLCTELGENVYACRTSFHNDLFDPLAEHLRKGIGDQAGSDMLSSIGWFKSEAPRMPAVVLFESSCFHSYTIIQTKVKQSQLAFIDDPKLIPIG